MRLNRLYGLPDLPSSLSAEQQVKIRISDIMANREKIIEAWIAETGVSPSDAVLCQQNMEDGTIRFWVETKAENEKRKARFAMSHQTGTGGDTK